MRDTELFEAALGLSSPWVVLRSEFDPDQKQLDLHIGFARGSRFACPACGAEGCGVHDVRERVWRHLNFFQHKTVLKASIPRVSCDKCGVKQVSPPWARTGSGFTLLFEAFLLSMVKAMPVANVAEIVEEHDTRIWRVLDHYVWRAVERLGLARSSRSRRTERRRAAATTTSVCSWTSVHQSSMSPTAGCSDGRRLRGVSGGARRQAREHHRRLDRHGGGVHRGREGELSQRQDHLRQVPCDQARQRGGGRGASHGSQAQRLDQGYALSVAEEPAEPRRGGEGLDRQAGGGQSGHHAGLANAAQNLQDVFTMPSVASGADYPVAGRPGSAPATSCR